MYFLRNRVAIIYRASPEKVITNLKPQTSNLKPLEAVSVYFLRNRVAIIYRASPEKVITNLKPQTSNLKPLEAVSVYFLRNRVAIILWASPRSEHDDFNLYFLSLGVCDTPKLSIWLRPKR